MPDTLTRIIFSGDSFRSANGGADQIDNVVWLQSKVGKLFDLLTGLPQEIRLPLVGRTVAEMIALQDGGTMPSLANWASLFWDSASTHLVGRIEEECGGALVITIEMPPILEDALTRAGVAWIDIGISPLRFLPDWAFHVKASRHFRLEAVGDYLLMSRDIERYAAHVGAWYGPSNIVKPTRVFFAQTLQDRTLIRNRGFAGKKEVLDELVSLRDEDRPLLIKPHPWQPDNDIVDALAKTGGKITELNSYALLASPQIEAITLSSSVGREARAFGRKVTIISPSVQDWAFSGVDVLRYATAPQFWGALLASANIPTASAAAQDADWRPNSLRGSIARQGLDPDVWKDAHDSIL